MGGYRLRWGFTCLFATTILGFGCAGLFPEKRPLPEIPADVLIRNIERHASQLQTFRGDARLAVVSAEGSFGGSLNVSMKIPDSLWVKIEGPWGIDIATGRFGGGQALFYNPWENVVYKGTVEKMQEKQLLPFDVGVSRMALGILGLLVPDAMGADSFVSLSSDSKKYILNFEDGEQVWVEPKGPVVTRWEKRDDDGEILWIWEAKDFKKKKGIRLPQLVRITNYQPMQRLTLFYEKVKANMPMGNGWWNIRIPEGVETVEL